MRYACRMGAPSYDPDTLAATIQAIHPETWNDPIVGPVLRRLAAESPDILAAVAAPERPRAAPILAAYAMMHAELTANPADVGATLARYGFSPATKPQEDAAWKARFAAEPALRMAGIRELMEAGNRVRGK